MAGDEPAADTIIDDYRAVVGRLKLSPEEVHDENELPHPRQQIIDALLAAYSLSGKTSHSPAELQGWLLTLAQFQPGVGEPIADMAAETARRMTTGGRPVEGAALQHLADEIAEEGAEKDWVTRRSRFNAKVAKERARLIGLLQQVR